MPDSTAQPPLSPGLEGVPCAASRISAIEGRAGRLTYRGYAIEDLAEHCTFEEVGWLLLHGELPSRLQLQAFDAELRQHRRLKYRLLDLLKTLPESGHPVDALQAATAAMGMFYPLRAVDDREAQHEAIVRLVAKLPTVVAAVARLRRGDEAIAPRDDLGHAANFLYMLTGGEPDPVAARTLDVSLILHAEHTMNASTFAARVVGSTLADPYAVVASAIGALSGPLHGGASEQVLDLLDAIGTPHRVAEVLGPALAAGRTIAGFGHRVYEGRDPRAPLLRGLAARLFDHLGADRRFEVAERVEAWAAEHLGPRGIHPNVDFYSGLVYARLGIDPANFTPIFAMARVTGWLAHWVEQLRNNRLYRPTQVYEGPRERPFTPLYQRG